MSEINFKSVELVVDNYKSMTKSQKISSKEMKIRLEVISELKDLLTAINIVTNE